LAAEHVNDKNITRGGNRHEPVHVILLVITTALLVIASICLIFHVAVIGILAMLVAIGIASWDFQRR
jgi:hypothetical protein